MSPAERRSQHIYTLQRNSVQRQLKATIRPGKVRLISCTLPIEGLHSSSFPSFAVCKRPRGGLPPSCALGRAPPLISSKIWSGVRVRRAQGHPPLGETSYTGHFSSFQAISQNIHS